MKRSIFIAVCIAVPVLVIAQAVSKEPTWGDFFTQVDTLSTLLAGFVTTVIAEVFNNYTLTKKTNALIAAICLSVAVTAALALIGIPTFGVGSVFTIASGMFAIYRKLIKAK